MKIGDGAKIGGKRRPMKEQVGISDQLTVTVKYNCDLGSECDMVRVKDLRFARLRTLHDGDRVELRTRQGEEKHTVSLYINWDGDVRLSSRETGKMLDIKNLRRYCYCCGRPTHSWREEDSDAGMAKDDREEGGT